MGYWRWYDDRDIRERTKAVFDLVQAGHNGSQIAKLLGVSQATISGDFKHLRELALISMGGDPYTTPYLLDMMGLRGARKEIEAAAKSLSESADPAARALSDLFRLGSRQLPGGE